MAVPGKPPVRRATRALFIILPAIIIASLAASPAARAEGPAAAPVPVVINAPSIWIKGVGAEVRVTVNAPLPAGSSCVLSGAPIARMSLPCATGEEVVFKGVKVGRTGTFQIHVSAGQYSASLSARAIHGLLTLLPPLIAIGLALAFRQVLAALWVSIWLGALIIYGWHPLTAVARSIDYYIIGAMAQPDDAAMLVFIIFMGGMIGMIAKSGGIQGIVDLVARRASSSRSGQIYTFLMGVFIFFDDYANTVIVGNTMRPITDRLRISREKLSYIVDATSAPVASIFPISTWIGYEVGLINKALESIGSDQSGYMVFLRSVPFRFYPILALCLVFLIAVTGRDFGPMARAERRARLEGKPLRDDAMPLSGLDVRATEPPPGKPRRWYNAMVPLLSMLGITFGGLWVNGVGALGTAGYAEVMAKSHEFGALWSRVYILGEVFSAASPNVVLAWASLGGCLITVFMVTTQRILTIGESMQAWLKGVEAMVIAVVILLLAWSLGQVCQDLHTADYLTSSLSGALSPRLLPVIVSLLACAISFATGTSYGTMAILMPLVIPIGHRLSLDAGFGPADQQLILVGVVSSVLAGAVFGDHCSPISDTTIMSSMASGADHIDHVRTQMPYALLPAALGMCLGDVPTAYGLPPAVSIVLAVAIMIGFLYLFGTRVNSQASGPRNKAEKERGEA